MVGWYPLSKMELEKTIENYLNFKILNQKINGIIVPHAGYLYSGEIAGKAFSYLKNSKIKSAIILGPNHYLSVKGVFSHNEEYWITPLGKIKVKENNFEKIDISKEHSIDNQIPFLQFLKFKEILPLMISYLNLNEIKELSKKISDEKGILVVSTDLSHFLDYDKAKYNDEKSINAIENLNSDYFLSFENSACGVFPLLVLFEICKLKKWKPKLIEYKNSGDIIGKKNSVVGYASFLF